jgi:hypothetical protein
MNNLQIRDEVSLLFFATLLCSETKSGTDGAWQIAPFFCSLPYREDSLQRLLELKDTLAVQFPELVAFGDRRAAKAYQTVHHSITKPSYSQRLHAYGPDHRDQTVNMRAIAKKEPSSGGLVFSVFDPRDLERRYRPGYVPCLVAGSFLLHENECQLNAFFRSQSIIEFGIQDLIFLRRFQRQMVDHLNEDLAKTSRQAISAGLLNLHFGRIIVQRRLMRHKRSYIRRDDVVEKWLSAVERFREHHVQ